MYSCIIGGTVFGIEGRLIRVETDVSNGLPGFHMVGCLSETVKEAGERIRTALRNSGYRFPSQKIVVNLSPADLPKSGTGFDLAIALSLLVSINIIPQELCNDILVLGELGLSGDVLPIHGVLPIVDAARSAGFCKVILPVENVREASLLKDMHIIGVRSLKALLGFLMGEPADILPGEDVLEEAEVYTEPPMDFKELHGQKIIRRGMEIAASGMHNLIMSGPPGAGKTMAARCLPGILPDLTYEARMMLTKIYSVKGLLEESGGLIRNRPFRAPHHTISSAALLGGGTYPRPGEISLAHEGVLFLDELPEFKRSVIEALRQPLEEGRVMVNRMRMTYEFPSNFMLVAAMNPCPCGCYPDRNKCHCSEHQIRMYQSRISRAILDRMDLNLSIQPVTFAQMNSDSDEESSAAIKTRVIRVHEIQQRRFLGRNLQYNSQMGSREIKEFCKLDTAGEEIMERYYKQYDLSARAYHRTLRLARTIADMDGKDQIMKTHILEACAYRFMNPSDGRDTL